VGTRPGRRHRQDVPGDGIGYAIFMSLGWLLIRVPADDWAPAGWDPALVREKPLVTSANVSARNAIRTPQFWLLWSCCAST